MTLLELKTQIALYCGKDSAADLVVGGTDLGLLAINQVRQQAEMEHDFEFSRKLLTVSVNSLTGGSLNEATVFGGTQELEVKTIVDVGLFDSGNNLIPVDWRTVSASLELQRKDNRYGTTLPRYPTDAQVLPFGTYGHARVTFSGDEVQVWPKTAPTTPVTTYQIGIEAYCFSPDYISAQLTPLLQVSGTLTPNVVGVYEEQVTQFQGYPVYVGGNFQWFLYYAGTLVKFVLRRGAPQSDPDPNYWFKDITGGFAGSYTAQGSNTGSPQVIVNYPIASDIWLTKGSQYLLWASVVHLNALHKGFVFRQEGNLPPPEKYRDDALQAFIDFDLFKYEQNRRHGI